MAAIDLGWSVSALRDVSMALRTSLGRVPRGSVQETEIADNWQKVQDWLAAVEQLISAPEQAFRSADVPPFPLTSQELGALLASIDRIAQARAAVSATKVVPSAKHLRTSIGRARKSAFGLGAVLLVCVAIPAIDLAIFHGERSLMYVALSLISSLAATAVWILHNSHLGAHQALIEQSHPLR